MILKIVPEYKGLDDFILRLEEEGLWRVEERVEMSQYGPGKVGLRHVLRVA